MNAKRVRVGILIGALALAGCGSANRGSAIEHGARVSAANLEASNLQSGGLRRADVSVLTTSVFTLGAGDVGSYDVDCGADIPLDSGFVTAHADANLRLAATYPTDTGYTLVFKNADVKPESFWLWVRCARSSQ